MFQKEPVDLQLRAQCGKLNQTMFDPTSLTLVCLKIDFLIMRRLKEFLRKPEKTQQDFCSYVDLQTSSRTQEPL